MIKIVDSVQFQITFFIHILHFHSISKACIEESKSPSTTLSQFWSVSFLLIFILVFDNLALAGVVFGLIEGKTLLVSCFI